jgi:hypothetical protein
MLEFVLEEFHPGNTSCHTWPGWTEDSYLSVESNFLAVAFGVPALGFFILALLFLARSGDRTSYGLLLLVACAVSGTRMSYFLLPDALITKVNPGLLLSLAGHFGLSAFLVSCFPFLVHVDGSSAGRWDYIHVVSFAIGLLATLAPLVTVLAWTDWFDVTANVDKLVVKIPGIVGHVLIGASSCHRSLFLVPQRAGLDNDHYGWRRSFLKGIFFQGVCLLGRALADGALLAFDKMYHESSSVLMTVETAVILYILLEVVPLLYLLGVALHFPPRLGNESVMAFLTKLSCAHIRNWHVAFTSFVFVLLSIVALFWGGHLSCYATAAVLGKALFLARAGASVIWVAVIPLYALPCQGVWSRLESSHFGLFLPRNEYGTHFLHGLFALIFILGVLIHVGSHVYLPMVTFPGLSPQEVIELQQRAPRVFAYFSEMRHLQSGWWCLPVITGLLIALMMIAICASVCCCRKFGKYFGFFHRKASLLALLLMSAHGLGAIFGHPQFYAFCIIAGAFQVAELYCASRCKQVTLRLHGQPSRDIIRTSFDPGDLKIDLAGTYILLKLTDLPGWHPFTLIPPPPVDGTPLVDEEGAPIAGEELLGAASSPSVVSQNEEVRRLETPLLPQPSRPEARCELHISIGHEASWTGRLDYKFRLAEENRRKAYPNHDLRVEISAIVMGPFRSSLADPDFMNPELADFVLMIGLAEGATPFLGHLNALDRTHRLKDKVWFFHRTPMKFNKYASHIARECERAATRLQRTTPILCTPTYTEDRSLFWTAIHNKLKGIHRNARIHVGFCGNAKALEELWEKLGTWKYNTPTLRIFPECFA